MDNLFDGLRINGHSEGRDESQNAFPVHSDEEDNVNEDEVPDLVDDDDEDEDLYESVDAQSFGDYPANDYAFQSGATEQSRGIEYWDNKSPLEIVLELAAGFFAVLLEMSNRAHPEAKLTMKDMYVYHAFLLLNCCFQFANLNYYWYPPKRLEGMKLLNQLPLKLSGRRFYHIRKYLRAYDVTDDVPGKDRGWKVNRAVEAVQYAFRHIIDCAGEYLSMDEGMAKGSSMRNPIYTSLGKAKPCTQTCTVP